MEKEILDQTIEFVKEKLKNAEGGHDWRHIFRVWKLAKKLLETEKADSLTVQLGALLNDIADWKFHNGDEEIGANISSKFLKSIGVNDEVIKHVENIILNIGFKGGKHEQKFKSPELDIVQDADRLDSLGAVGIARTFNYGGFKGRELYNPEVKPNLHMTKEQYRTSTAPSLNHFYEKLLLLKERMNTTTGKKLAEHRHQVLEDYLEEFYKEREAEV